MCKYLFNYQIFFHVIYLPTLAMPTVEIQKIDTRNGEYFVVWNIVQNGGGKLRKLELEYGVVSS